MIDGAEFKDWRDVVAPVIVELADLHACGGRQTQFAGHLVIDAKIRLLEGLIHTWIIHKIPTEGTSDAQRQLWRHNIVNVKPGGDNLGVDKIITIVIN